MNFFLKPKNSYKITGFASNCSIEFKNQFVAMGIIPNVVFTFMYEAPFGDPIAIEIKGSLLFIRKKHMVNLVIQDL